MGQAADGKIGEVKFLEMLLGIERNPALDVDVVAEDLEIVEKRRAILLRGKIELKRGGTAGAAWSSRARRTEAAPR